MGLLHCKTNPTYTFSICNHLVIQLRPMKAVLCARHRLDTWGAFHLKNTVEF